MSGRVESEDGRNERCWKWWHCGGVGVGVGVGWSWKRTRIANWSDMAIELKLQDSRTNITVREYRVSPGGRKKVRIARARELCGGDDSNVVVLVCRPGSEEPLTDSISGNDLQANVEIKIRQLGPNGQAPSFFLLKIPRNTPSPSSRYSESLRHRHHRSSSLVSSSHNSPFLVPAAPTVISSQSSNAGGSFHHVLPTVPLPLPLPHPHLHSLNFQHHHHSLLHLGHHPRSRSSSSLASPFHEGTPPLGHSMSFPGVAPRCPDCIAINAMSAFQQGGAAAAIPLCTVCNALAMAQSTAISCANCNGLAMAQQTSTDCNGVAMSQQVESACADCRNGVEVKNEGDMSADSYDNGRAGEQEEAGGVV